MNSRKKKKMQTALAIISIFFVFVMSVVFVLTRNNTKSKPTTSSTQSISSSKTSSSSSTSESNELSENDINYRKALATLEQSDKPVENSQLQNVDSSVREAIAYAKTIEKTSEVELTSENHLDMTDESMALSFIIMFARDGGYTYDSAKTEVFYSNSSDVLQFLIVLNKKDELNSYWVGNYNILTKSLQFTSYQGSYYWDTFG